ncbi:MAG: ATP synthase protein I [Chlamydiales bacterium]|jgi:ATP synthase protein I
MNPNAPNDSDRKDAGSSRARELAIQGKEYGRLSGIGMQFALTIVLMAFAGHWLDRRLGTLPLFLILGVLLGFLGGTISMIKRVSPTERSQPDDTVQPPKT